MKQIKSQILNDNPCPVLAKQANLIIGVGNETARIVFVGEAPGRKEDETGEPFVGASGKMLNHLLETVGLDREQVYITNIVKYRPPNNRDPKRSEITAMLPYLIKQLELIKPDVVVTLGRHPLASLNPELKIADAHGQISELKIGGYRGKLLPLYHPAYAIYGRKNLPLLEQDFEALRPFC